MENVIRSKVELDLQPELVNIENESHMHGGPATDSHFNLTVVSTQFDAMPLVKRHQRIYKLLASELAGSVHALALHLYTPGEWSEKGNSAPASPDCRGV